MGRDINIVFLINVGRESTWEEDNCQEAKSIEILGICSAIFKAISHPYC